MTREDKKQLLFKDLCMRLPYGTIVSIKDDKIRKDMKLIQNYIFDWDAERWDAKPYLRPMESMTEEEYKELTEYTELDCSYDLVKSNLFEAEGLWSGYFFLSALIDWLLKHHFDYRNLIDLRLANKAPEGMYKNEE